MYSVSKSLSTSTPRVLLGRSFTWPSEASTVKPLPRYFWMVFALAGDSTMTKPFDNGSSISLEFVSKLARMSSAQQVTERKLSAVSHQLSAFASAMTAFVSLLQLRRKDACNQWVSATPSLLPTASDTRLHLPTLQPSGGNAQTPHRPFDMSPPRCWNRWKPTPSASDSSTRTSLRAGTTC